MFAGVPYRASWGEGSGLATAIRNYIDTNYIFSPADLAQIDSALGEFAQIRDRSSKASALPGEKAVEVSSQYYSLLCELENRFPFRQYKTSMFSKKALAVMIEFKFSNALVATAPLKSFDIGFEKASILFNVGAAFSLCGATTDCSSSEGYSNAAKFFMRAAGVFQYMIQNPVLITAQESLDLSLSGLEWMSNLMLAQAAVCTFESAVLKNMSPGVISKLAKGASALFEPLTSFVGSGSRMRAQSLTIAKLWEKHIKFFQLHMLASSHFFLAKEELKEDAFGHEIARLNQALSICEENKAFTKKSGAFELARARLAGDIQQRLKEAVKDNESLYFAKVPASVSSPISHTLVKSIPFEPVSFPLPKIFDKIIPTEIQEAASHLADELKQKYNSLRDRTSEKTDILKATLASLHLPGSLDAVEHVEKIPPDVRVQFCGIQSEGEMFLIHDLYRETKESNDGCMRLLSEVEDLLDAELANDKKMRSSFGFKWSRPRSEEVATEYHHDLSKARKYMEQACIAQEKIERAMKSQSKSLSILSKDVTEIESMIPSLSKPIDLEASAPVRKLLDELSFSVQERENKLKEIEKFLTETNFAAKLMALPRGTLLSSGVASEKAEFDKKSTLLLELLKGQDLLLERVDKANTDFLKTRSMDAELARKERVLQDINDAMETFRKLKRDLNQGKSFYLDLIANCLEPLKLNVEGFTAAREAERQILENDLVSRSRGESDAKPDFEPSAPEGGFPSWR